MRFKAFFSYSRSDDAVARWLHRRLDGYRTPKGLVGTQGVHGQVPPSLPPIFRDRTDLQSGGEIDGKLQEALEASETLIVLCSPKAANSRWVEHECQTFLRLGRQHQVFPVIASGEPDSGDPKTECFPPSLRGRGVLAADLRDKRGVDGKQVGDGKEGGRLKLTAGLLGVPLDALVQRESARQRRTVATLATALAIFVAVALFAAVQMLVAQDNRIESDKQRLRAEAQSEAAAQSAAEANRQRGIAEQKVQAERLARDAEAEQRKRAEASATAAMNQYQVTNGNTIQLAKAIVGLQQSRLGDKRVYFIETPHLIKNRDDLNNVAIPADRGFWSECPRSFSKCFDQTGAAIAYRPSGIIYARNVALRSHAPSVAGFRRICGRFENFSGPKLLGRSVCVGGATDITDTSPGSGTVRLGGLPGDQVLVLYDEDGTPGVDFGSFGWKSAFQLWIKRSDGSFRRLDDATASRESAKNWLRGSELAIVLDKQDQVVEVFTWEAFGRLDGGVELNRFDVGADGILRSAANIRIGETHADDDSLPPILRLETDSN